MGLDITSYSKLQRIGKHFEGPWCSDYDGQHIQAFAYAAFPRSLRGVPYLAPEVSRDGTEFLAGGCYQTTEATKTYPFSAGSYVGYGLWRADLAEQFNPDADPEGPFFELIYFADNEGVIGPEAAADLLADFREHAERYLSPGEQAGEYYRDRYRDWTRAFELAADDGLVVFH